jgi:ABC-type glutathione transport system ATPase component
MRQRFDAIVDFAGLERFIDQPVRHYSSGMYVRLGFAVAVEIDPQILLIDEVLAVGDAVFQRKCLARMAEFRQQRKTMLIISHDLPTIQGISDRILILDSGRVLGDGDPTAMIQKYEAFWRQKTSADLRREWGTREVLLAGVDIVNQRGEPADRFEWGDTLAARIRYSASRRLENPVFGFAVSDEHGRVVSGNNTQIEGLAIPAIEGEGTVTLQLPELRLATGTYLLSFSVHSADHKTNYHRLDNLVAVAVKAAKDFDGACYLPCRFSHAPGRGTP